MKKLLVSAIALSALLWVGCGGDDDDDGGGGGGDSTITVTADTMTAPAIPLVYNDDAWDDVTATSISIFTGNTLPVAPTKTPVGPDKTLSAPSSVDFQAIKKGGRLFLRFQWDDVSLSMQRDNWRLLDNEDLNFIHNEMLNGEDELWISFEGAPSGGWDTWNWRVLTTGQVNRAEDGTVMNGDTTWDAGVNTAASMNIPYTAGRPTYLHVDEWAFTGDVLLKSERLNFELNFNQVYGSRRNWTNNQTVPGWYINDDVDWANITESRWDVQAVYNYVDGVDGPGLYTLVMVRDLAGAADDLDMSETDRVKTRVGIFEDFYDVEDTGGSSRRKFSEDFWLVLP